MPLCPRLGVRAVAVAAPLVLLLAGLQALPANDVLRMFPPERRALIATGVPVIDVPSEKGADFAVRGAVRTVADFDRLVTWARAVEHLYGGRYVPLVRRFSNPPVIEDLSTLVLDDDELEDLRDCRPGHCGVKLGAEDMALIASRIDAAGRGWKEAAQRAFREVMLSRAQTYLSRGLSGLPAYADHKSAEDPVEETTVLVESLRADPLCTPRVSRFVLEFPRIEPEVESFLYWSKDLLGDAKPILSVTHLAIVDEPDRAAATIVATQIFATHYLLASISLTSIRPTEEPGLQYLVYSRRSRTDVFDGAFGGLVRRMVAKRVRADGPAVLEQLRRKIESGYPPR